MGKRTILSLVTMLGLTLTTMTFVSESRATGTFLNGSFEENLGAKSGWQMKATEIKGKQGAVTAFEGSKYADLGEASVMYQDIPTSPNSTMYWSVMHKGLEGTEGIEIFIGSSETDMKSVMTMSTGSEDWKIYSGIYTVPEGQTSTRLEFRSKGKSSSGNLLDNIIFTSDIPTDISVDKGPEYPTEELPPVPRDSRAVFGSEMYRLYNPNTSEHFYTSNPGERDNIVLGSWWYEGIGWDSPSTGSPVYRLYNVKLDDHHYTMNAGERDNLVRSSGWQYEGVGWNSDSSFGSPVYRLYNPKLKSGQHHYTLSVAERDNLIRNHGWKDEGIGFYGGVNKNTDNSYSSVIKNNLPYYNQNAWGQPMGCESVSLLQALQSKGKAINYNPTSFTREMPISPNKNPNNGFAGSPYEIMYDGTYQAIFPAPLATWGQRYGNVVNVSGFSSTQLRQEIRKNNPVVVWVTYDFTSPYWRDYHWGTGMEILHVMTLFGYNDSTRKMLVSDPLRGRYWVSYDLFDRSYNMTRHAVSVR